MVVRPSGLGLAALLQVLVCSSLFFLWCLPGAVSRAEAVMAVRAVGDRAAGTLTPLIRPLLLLARRSLGDLATAPAGGHRAMLIIRLRASVWGAASILYCSSSILTAASGPLAPSSVLMCAPRGQLLQSRKASPWATQKPGGLPGGTPARTPPQPQQEQGRPRPRAGEESNLESLAVSSSVQHREAGKVRARVAGQAGQRPPRSRRGQVWLPSLAI